MIRVGIIGSTGYVGSELLRLLLQRSDVKIVWFGSHSYIGKRYSDVYRNFFQLVDAECLDDNLEQLAFLSDVPGVYRDPNDPSSLIYELPYDELTALIESGAITGGMLPKLLSCKDAIDNGVSRVHIMDGRIPHCVLLEIFTNQGIGTAIMSKNSERYYRV